MEFHIAGFRNRDLRAVLKDLTPASISRLLKRLRLHGILRKVASSYRYLLTPLGKHILTTGLKLRAEFLIPQLAQPAPA
jgi:DNA-binding HxlR family transcriptional regulator